MFYINIKMDLIVKPIKLQVFVFLVYKLLKFVFNIFPGNFKQMKF